MSIFLFQAGISQYNFILLWICLSGSLDLSGSPDLSGSLNFSCSPDVSGSWICQVQQTCQAPGLIRFTGHNLFLNMCLLYFTVLYSMSGYFMVLYGIIYIFFLLKMYCTFFYFTVIYGSFLLLSGSIFIVIHGTFRYFMVSQIPSSYFRLLYVNTV